MRYMLIVLIAIVMMGAAETECYTPTPTQCPTVGEEFRTSHHLSLSTRSAIQPSLADPGSYEFLDMTPQSESTYEFRKQDMIHFMINEIQNPYRIGKVSHLEALRADVEDMTPWWVFTVERADGRSSYHSYVTVDFTAKNAFGDRVAGTADVTLIEWEDVPDKEDGCAASFAILTG